jgi:uncharacterized BrkB/YihY/UPF0761 family membrane protein
MALTSVLPFITGVLLIAFIFQSINRSEKINMIWIFPATLSFLFLLLSITAVINEGPFGFWTEHTRNFWGNQIWVDLLLAAGIGWYFILPRAKNQNMNLIFWGTLIIATGCIGFTAMVSRLLYLEENSKEEKRANA